MSKQYPDETTIYLARAEEFVSVYTTRKAIAHKLLNYGAQVLYTDSDDDGNIVRWRFYIPKDWFRLPFPPSEARMKRAVTPDQIAKMQAGRKKKDLV